MVNRFSQITPIQEYKSDVPVELMMKVGQMRQQQFDLGKQQLDQNLAKGRSVGAAIINDELRTEYEKQFETASSALQKDFSTADLSDTTVLSQANALFDPIAKSDRFLSAYTESLRRRDVEKQYRNAAERNDGSYHSGLHKRTLREMQEFKTAKGDDALRMQAPGFLANQKLNERLQKLMQSMKVEADVDITNISPMQFLIKTSEGYSKTRVLKAIEGMLTPQDMEQLRAEADEVYGELDYNGLKSVYMNNIGSDKELIQKQIADLDATIAVGARNKNISDRDLKILDQEKEALKNKLAKADADASKFDAEYRQGKGKDLAYKAYTTAKMNEWLTTYAVTTKEEIKMEQNVAEVERFKAQHAINLETIKQQNETTRLLMKMENDVNLQKMKLGITDEYGNPPLPSLAVGDEEQTMELSDFIIQQQELTNAEYDIHMNFAKKLQSDFPNTTFLQNGKPTQAFFSYLKKIRSAPDGTDASAYSSFLQQYTDIELKKSIGGILSNRIISELSTSDNEIKRLGNFKLINNESVKNVYSSLFNQYGEQVFTSPENVIRALKVKGINVGPNQAQLFIDLNTRIMNSKTKVNEILKSAAVSKGYEAYYAIKPVNFGEAEEKNLYDGAVNQVREVIKQQHPDIDENNLTSITPVQINKNGKLKVNYTNKSGSGTVNKTIELDVSNNPNLRAYFSRSMPKGDYNEYHVVLDQLGNSNVGSETGMLNSWSNVPFKFSKGIGNSINLHLYNKEDATWKQMPFDINRLFNNTRDPNAAALQFVSRLNMLPKKDLESVLQSQSIDEISRIINKK